MIEAMGFAHVPPLSHPLNPTPQRFGDLGAEREALEVIARALNERRRLVLTIAHHGDVFTAHRVKSRDQCDV